MCPGRGISDAHQADVQDHLPAAAVLRGEGGTLTYPGWVSPTDMSAGGPGPVAPAPAEQEQLVDALLVASRALVAIAGRSLAEQDSDVTLPQYRALVVLASRGPQRVVDISAELGVDPSTGTRLCDRLVRKELIHRERSTSDRRAVRVTLSEAGRSLVDQVTQRRREALTQVVSSMDRPWDPGVAAGLRAFAAATGEVPEEQWWMGWAVTGRGGVPGHLDDPGDETVPGQ